MNFKGIAKELKRDSRKRVKDYSVQARNNISEAAYWLGDRIRPVEQKPVEVPKIEKIQKFGNVIETDQGLTFDQFDFEGPLMHVGSKINYEDQEAKSGADRFRAFLDQKLHGSKEVLGLDIFEGENVDIVADLCKSDLFEGDLSQHENYFKTVLCWALLEHVKDPFAVARNIEKFLAPGGKIFFVGPWVWGYHPYPDDYWRISFSGLKELFPNVEWHDWWYTGMKDKVGYKIGEARYERKVFQLKSDITAEMDTVSDRYMPYLNIFAVGSKR